MTNKEKREWLERYGDCLLMCELCQKELDDLNRISASRLSLTPKGNGARSSVENTVKKRFKIVEERDKLLQELETIREEITKAISHLELKERTVLKLRYINLLTWQESAEFLDLSTSSAYRLHAQAISHLVVNNSK